jgi:hypothetical protein
MIYDMSNADFRVRKFFANPSAIDQGYRWEYCPKRERHLLMYCEYWLKKLADEQWREEQLRGRSQVMLNYISCPSAHEPCTVGLYISCNKEADKKIAM